MTTPIIRATATAGIALGLAGLVGCSSDTSQLEVGDCVRVEAGDFTFGGDADTVPCDEVELFSDNYRVTDTGSESDMDDRCPPADLIIVDGDDAACLTQ